MLDDIVGTYGSRLFVAAGGVAVALLVLVGVLWLVRNRAPSPFVRGGKGRQQRLQVLDAAAIDARRRIVLIRRDGVEHLVMIGGPTDIVIETGIGDPSKMPLAQAAIATPAPLEALAGKDPVRSSPQLESPREMARVTHRQPEPAVQPSPRPVQATIAAPSTVVPERRPSSEPKPLSPIPAAAIAPSVERPQPSATPVQSEPTVQSAPQQRIEPVVFERKEEAAAADILEAARNRVLAPQSERPPEVVASAPQAPNPVPPAPILVQDAYSESYDVLTPEASPQRKLGSDFERVLEAEMSNRLTAEPVVQPPRRDSDMGPVGGDAALQKEVARIFGEITVDRDK